MAVLSLESSFVLQQIHGSCRVNMSFMIQTQQRGSSSVCSWNISWYTDNKGTKGILSNNKKPSSCKKLSSTGIWTLHFIPKVTANNKMNIMGKFQREGRWAKVQTSSCKLSSLTCILTSPKWSHSPVPPSHHAIPSTAYLHHQLTGAQPPAMCTCFLDAQPALPPEECTF